MFEIGVDIGGTNIKYGLVNEALEIVAHGSIPFPKTTAEDMADKLAAALRAMLAEQGVTEIGSIGIVVPGSIDRSGEVVIAAYNLGFHDVPLRAIMQARFPGVPGLHRERRERRGAGRALQGCVRRLQDGGALHVGHGLWRGHHSGWQDVQRRHEPRRGAGPFVSGRGRRSLHLRQSRLHRSLLRGQCAGPRRRRAMQAHPESMLAEKSGGDAGKGRRAPRDRLRQGGRPGGEGGL